MIVWALKIKKPYDWYGRQYAYVYLGRDLLEYNTTLDNARFFLTREMARNYREDTNKKDTHKVVKISIKEIN